MEYSKIYAIESILKKAVNVPNHPYFNLVISELLVDYMTLFADGLAITIKLK